MIPLRNGQRQRVVLGFDQFAPYPLHSPYFGAVVGRYANRISGGGFWLNDTWHKLTSNDGPAITLHGGVRGFSDLVWTVHDLTSQSVTLGLISPDGDQGFPGTLEVRCRYTLCDDTRLVVEFRARTTQTTVVNLCQHAYFNLDGSETIGDHGLTVFADAYTPLGDDQIPTGQIVGVAGTPFDLRAAQSVNDPSRPANLDNNYVLRQPLAGQSLRHAAKLWSRKNGLALDLWTSKPGVQVYDGHHIDVPVPGLGGQIYRSKGGLCLEPQFFPDSPNRPNFPSSILAPDAFYDTRSDYLFSQTDHQT
jgi:aldose 1-epimerase